jgi:hypothetical protein
MTTAVESDASPGEALSASYMFWIMYKITDATANFIHDQPLRPKKYNAEVGPGFRPQIEPLGSVDSAQAIISVSDLLPGLARWAPPAS